MSESTPKGVTVKVPVNMTINEVRHENASLIDVEDGHLRVEADTQRTVAIYAPGKWLSAVVG